MEARQLPEYVVHVEGLPSPEVLRTESSTLKFPLSEQDLEDIKTLSDKYDSEENIAGLAAPQIGIAKRAIIFAVKDDPELKKWRTDLTDTMPRSIWLNPEYKGMEEYGFSEDYEGCFSVADHAGLVSRYNVIEYRAFDIHGAEIKGVARGFLARVIQHEIDHINGVLYIDRAEKIFSIDEYRSMREAAMSQ